MRRLVKNKTRRLTENNTNDCLIVVVNHLFKTAHHVQVYVKNKIYSFNFVFYAQVQSTALVEVISSGLMIQMSFTLLGIQESLALDWTVP